MFRNTTQQYWGNFFEYHRRGLTSGTAKPWEDPDVAPLFVRPPRGAAWDGSYPGGVQALLDLQARSRWGYEVFNRRAGRGARSQKIIDAEVAAQGIRDRLAAQGMVIRLVKVLSAGGNGIASLFEVWPGGEGAPSKKVVVKSLLRAEMSMNDEANVTAALRRARHVVQLRSWGREIMPTPGSDAAALAAQWLPVDGDSAMMTLEFMRHGDLHGLIKKIATSRDRAPNKVLWRVFFCLIRGCIAMFVPPRSRRGPDGLVLPENQWQDFFGPELDEVMPVGTPQLPNPEGWDLVHFDLDPQNILVGENDGDEHSMAPVFKISDLGLAKQSDDDLFLAPCCESMGLAEIGQDKHLAAGMLMPKLTEMQTAERSVTNEPRHKEWDYIDKSPAMEPTEPQVAGQYGPWSNIFQAATCMQNLITRTQTPYPPGAVGPLNAPEGAHLFPGPTVIRDSAGRAVAPFHTHGYTLVWERGLDQDLMHLLFRCLADLPRDRPPLAELQFLMRTMEGADGWAVGPGDPDGVRAWCTRQFSDPPAPPTAREIYATLAPEALAAAQIEVPRTERIPPREDGGGAVDDLVDRFAPGVQPPYVDGALLVPETAPMISGTTLVDTVPPGAGQ
ncbi:hypothetical protein Daus18300_012874 [Diaporthe australafricana]|uniref:Protein kinase domain-containing protein n=1 Tax=Diaporthe australafricana TaxID=127596 RepID=A0ABR3W194_9PEZI